MDRLACGRSFALVVCLLSGVLGCDERRYEIPPIVVVPPDAATTDVVVPMFEVPPSPDVPDAPMVDPDAPMVDPDGGGSADAGPSCGNGVVESGEVCDDGNGRPGDGCSGVCTVEPNYSCPTAGQACVSLVVCGDGKISGNEACDDANAMGGDGCSASCQVEAGYACAEAGKPCTMAPTSRCGDGQVNTGEGCDDGNTTGADGCSATCSLEGGFSCPTPGMACVRDAYCGDGRVNGNEMCDDGNASPGDGCTGSCVKEPFFDCPMAGGMCTTTIVCGDSKVVGDEACDDGNTAAGDGCGPTCKQVEPGFSCPRASGVGGACTAVPMEVCGDGRVSFANGEFCDDGNTTAGDGCGATCRVEPGYTCATPGMACMLVELCGDGRLALARGEQCDDGNTTAGDGCTGQCALEANFVCPMPGRPCASTVVCGDGRISGAEQCDDRGTAAGDGCSATCTVEAGWMCPAGGTCRAARCGDGILVGAERCDDGNALAGDGCSVACTVESPAPSENNGWICPTAGMPCVRTTCGNGMPEGSEQCDDGNLEINDGCTPFCRKVPTCAAGPGACTPPCGDGLLLAADRAAGFECDDGNNQAGDGCSPACKIERGWMCTDDQVGDDPTLRLPVIYRDFRPYWEPNGHEDFNAFGSGIEANIVQPLLADDGKPLHVAVSRTRTVNNDTVAPPRDGVAPPAPAGNHNNFVVGFDYFRWWFRDNMMFNRTIPGTQILDRLPAGSGFPGGYQYFQQDYFPIEGQGFGTYVPPSGTHPNGRPNRNNHFTTEARYWFEYKGTGTEQLDFTGDDDVWVFVNKQLAVDLGGMHNAINGSITLGAVPGALAGNGSVCDIQVAGYSTSTGCGAARRTVTLGLQQGQLYEIVLFQAERRATDSSYRLTLANFNAVTSICRTVCGDGVVTPDEACDLGTAMNTGAYGTCNPNCTLGPRCGDAMVNGSEQCDDGANQSVYGGTMPRCAAGCVNSGYCGDGRVDAAHGEACDQGADNGRGYGFCTSTCGLGLRCGDGVTTDGEECDQGALNGMATATCTAMCRRKCGNGVADPGEECDSGTAMNTGAYGQCTPMCTQGPRCGDGIRNGPEACDDGRNDGSYGTCAPMCLLGPRCGDMVVQSTAGEVCDQGAMNSSMAYGPMKCDARCRPAPYCGDKKVDAGFGEVCDDGVNSGQPGSCKMDCTGNIPLPSCGDGIVQTNEQCDLGAMNGQMGSACDARCRHMCGNGIRDPGESCDDGVNNGAYGTCRPNCQLADYCGDGTKNGPEQCDQGMANQANPYGPNKCTTMCTTAPYCGDGRIQTAFGETCDSTPLCNATCTKIQID